MATPAVDRALLDTNVLLGATDEARPEHEHAVAVLTEWPASGVVLFTSGQILREYLVVATRPPERNGLGLSRLEAVANTRALQARLTLVPEDVRVSERLLELLGEFECSGKQIHDANVVATMLVHGIETVITSNVDDFARFADYVYIVRPQP